MNYTIDQFSDYEIESLCKLTNSLTEKRWSEAGLVSILTLIVDELELVRISTYSEKKDISTQQARKTNVIKIDNVQFKSLK